VPETSSHSTAHQDPRANASLLSVFEPVTSVPVPEKCGPRNPTSAEAAAGNRARAHSTAVTIRVRRCTRLLVEGGGSVGSSGAGVQGDPIRSS
jgi:hypothetical protein